MYLLRVAIARPRRYRTTEWVLHCEQSISHVHPSYHHRGYQTHPSSSSSLSLCTRYADGSCSTISAGHSGRTLARIVLLVAGFGADTRAPAIVASSLAIAPAAVARGSPLVDASLVLGFLRTGLTVSHPGVQTRSNDSRSSVCTAVGGALEG